MSRSLFRSSPGPVRSGGAIRIAFIALVMMLAPGLAMALTSTVTISDPGGSGYGASVFLDDAADPGNVSITLDSTGPDAALPDLLAFYIVYDEPAYFPDLDVTGTDVAEVGNMLSLYPPSECDCNVIFADLGPLYVFNPTGLTSTSALLEHPTEDVTLQALADATVVVFLGFDIDDPEAPGQAIQDVKVLKLGGTITVIPEPSTALLMLLGLTGLAGASRRIEA